MTTTLHKRLNSLLCILLAGTSLTYASISDIIIPPSPQSGPSNAQFVSFSNGLDAPKVTPINTTSFDWWYFDAVSLSSNASIVMTFFTAAEAGFPAVGNQTTVDSVDINVSFPNGTAISFNALATEAVVEVDSEGQGSSGIWNGTGLAWEGSNDLSQYVIRLDSPSLGIEGMIVFESVSLSAQKYHQYRLIYLLSDCSRSLSMRSCRSRSKHGSKPSDWLVECHSRLYCCGEHFLWNECT